MKIAILTLRLDTNYGGILQAYALQTVLKRMGHEVETIQMRPKYFRMPWMLPLFYIKRLFRKICVDKNTHIFVEGQIMRDRETIGKYTHLFIERHLSIRYINSFSDIQATDYDAFIVGSDQVWRRPYFTEDYYSAISAAYINFSKKWNIKRVSFAASFGVDNVNEYSVRDIKECANALSRFDAVSVRELSGIKICLDLFGVKAEQHQDPTLLLQKEDYLNIIGQHQNHTSTCKGGLMCYFLDDNQYKQSIVKQICKQHGFTPFVVNAPVDDKSIPAKQRIQPPVEDWLRGFRDADFVVTDSFHACVFSIIFNKPFIVIGNSERGMSRFHSLLSIFGLTNRLITATSSQDFTAEEIDWREINSVINAEQSKAFEYLSFNLS